MPVKGTPHYMPIEAFKGYFDTSSDIWSTGVILYVILSGRMPFFGETQFKIFLKIVEGKINFNDKEWDSVSDVAKELVEQILTKKHLRLTAL